MTIETDPNVFQMIIQLTGSIVKVIINDIFGKIAGN